MKVKELIEVLQTLNLERIVLVEIESKIYHITSATHGCNEMDGTVFLDVED